jgi:hypothetical protein
MTGGNSADEWKVRARGKGEDVNARLRMDSISDCLFL